MHAAKIRRKNETSKHFGGLFTKKGGDSIAVATHINDEYLIIMYHLNEISRLIP